MLTSELRKAHPDVSDSAIVNYLVTAYCAVVNRDDSLSVKAKRKTLDAFSVRARKVDEQSRD